FLGISRAQLEGVTPTLTYYAGTSASGTPLPSPPSQAGTYTVVATFAGSQNYAPAQSSPVTFSILAAPLVVTANNASKIYGQANPAFTATIIGFVHGDTASSLSGTLTFATATTAASLVGSDPVTPSGLTSTNYTITFGSGTLTITVAAL